MFTASPLSGRSVLGKSIRAHTEDLEMDSLIFSVCAYCMDTLGESWEPSNPTVEFSGLQDPRGGWKAVLESVSEYPDREIRRAVGYPLTNCAGFPKEVRLPNF